MKLTLCGHEDRYAVEQLQMALFPEGTEGDAVSTLHRGKVWLTAVTKITLNGKTATASRRLKAVREDVRLRRRMLQQSNKQAWASASIFIGICLLLIIGVVCFLVHNPEALDYLLRVAG